MVDSLLLRGFSHSTARNASGTPDKRAKLGNLGQFAHCSATQNRMTEPILRREGRDLSAGKSLWVVTFSCLMLAFSSNNTFHGARRSSFVRV